jgi:hypothetical protein
VHPGEVCLEKCLATIPPAGLETVAGEPFEFDVLVKVGTPFPVPLASSLRLFELLTAANRSILESNSVN